MSEFDRLWASVYENLSDAAPKLVLADWLQERGSNQELEAGLRWCGTHGRYPYLVRVHYSRRPYWQFRRAGEPRGSPRPESELSDWLWERVNDQAATSGGLWRVYRGARASDIRTLLRRLGRAVLGAAPYGH
jgi:uncharacterized protein (TIGR02996 family)